MKIIKIFIISLSKSVILKEYSATEEAYSPNLNCNTIF